MVISGIIRIIRGGVKGGATRQSMVMSGIIRIIRGGVEGGATRQSRWCQAEAANAICVSQLVQKKWAEE